MILDDIIASATPAERDVKICVAGALNARFAVLDAELQELQQRRFVGDSLGDADPRRTIAEEMEDLREQMKTHEHVFTMRALPPKVWSDLRAAHGPREGRMEHYNPETFPLALVSVSCVKVDGEDVELSTDKVGELFDVLNEGQRTELFGAAWEANTGRVSIPFSATASAVRQTSEQK